MGEVWQATDTKLRREVAIKVLPEAFARDGERMARFAREAQLLASLNHPSIASVYGVKYSAPILELVPGRAVGHRQLGRRPQRALVHSVWRKLADD